MSAPDAEASGPQPGPAVRRPDSGDKGADRVSGGPTRVAAADSTQVNLGAGSKIGEKYVVEKLLARGGMGEVYLALHTGLARKVAIKLLPSNVTGDPEWIQRFRREARVMARLQHPNIVEVHDSGQHKGQDYLVMEYIEGRDLESVLKSQGPMRVVDALAVAKRICLALEAAHALGVIHRDIKPSNVLITKTKVKVADFGLSREMSGSNATQPGHIVGTPHYMSPEQCKGEPLDARSDLYSAGATLYHVLSGQPPYAGGAALSVLIQHSDPRTTPEPLRRVNPAIPPAVEGLVSRLMAKRPEDRFQSAAEAASAIDAILKTERTGAPRRAPPWIFIAAAALAVVVGLGLAWRAHRRPAAPDEPGKKAEAPPDAGPKPPETPPKKPDAAPKQPDSALPADPRAREAERKKALDELERFARANPGQPKELRRRATLLQALHGEKETGSAVARILARASEASLRARAERMAELWMAHDIEALIDLVDPEQVMEHGRNGLRIGMQIAMGLGERGGWKVEAMLVRLIELDGHEARVHLSVGAVHEKQGKKQRQDQVHPWVLRGGVWYMRWGPRRPGKK